MEQLERKHYYGLAAIGVSVAALLFGLVSWFINQKIDMPVQVAFAVALLGMALFAWLEVDLLTRALGTRQARFGAETLVMVVAFLGVVGLLNYIFTQDRLKKRWDLTENQQHTLAPETLKVLSELAAPVKVIGFYTANASFSQQSAEDLLSDYKANSGGKLAYEFVDPQVKPTLAQQYGITQDASLVVESGSQREPVDFANESSLTNAIVRLNNPTVRTVYFVSGHGELSADDTAQTGLSQLKTTLESVNFQVRTLDVITQTLPSDASSIVIAGPVQAYTESEVKAIGAYLAGGGKAVMLIDPSPVMGLKAGDPDPLAAYLSATWGLTLRDDIVVDSTQYIPDLGTLAPATISYGASPITQDLDRVVSFFPTNRSIAVPDGAAVPARVSFVTLVKSGPDAWGETNFDSISAGNAAPDDADASGELALAVTAENSTTGARLVVFGGSQFAINGFDRQGANSLLLLNAVKWATVADQLIGLTPKDTVSRSLRVMTFKDTAIAFMLSCILPPLLVLVGGVAVWWSRRRQA